MRSTGLRQTQIPNAAVPMRHAILVLGLCLSCTSATPPSSPTPSPSPTKESPTKESPVENDADRWRCAKDEDCTQTCALGAVSKQWLEAHADADSCDDGCGWKWGKQACRDDECVTLDEKGGIDPSCTKLEKPLFE